ACGPLQTPEPGASGALDETPRGSGAPAAARVSYDVPRDGVPWGSKISAYLLTKSIGAGALMVGGLGLLLFKNSPSEKVGFLPPLLAFLFLNLTSLFLVADLRRPDRFMLLILKGRLESWLVKGAYVLLCSVILASIWGIASLSGYHWGAVVWHGLGLLAVGVGGAAAGYTAFLFAQARGRLFWQSPLLFPHLLVQAIAAGAAGLALACVLEQLITPGSTVVFEGRMVRLGGVLALGLVLNGVMIMGELSSHSSEDARIASRWISEGPGGNVLFWGVFVLGHIAPLVALALGLWLPANEGASPVLAIGVAGGASLVGLFLWDDLYVRAGQVPALS
ncbi:MAG: polysulfide reductase NrfD, partial [Planctomycetes bacterium]|nr:polysulfide reductase NrfD [Planctomycetota bacterium]